MAAVTGRQANDSHRVHLCRYAHMLEATDQHCIHDAHGHTDDVRSPGEWPGLSHRLLRVSRAQPNCAEDNFDAR
jgi:hypothetical protein